MQAAYEEMYRSGYRSADLDAILAAAGVTKGALYYHFDDKEALGHAVVDEVIAGSVQRKWVQPLRNATNPIDTLVRIVRSESLKREDVQRGCPLLNLSQEMSGLDEGFRRRTAKLFKDWRDAVAEALREGQKRRVVRSDIDVNETATFLIAAYEGYVVLTKNSQDARMMRSGQTRVIRLLESLRGKGGRTEGSASQGSVANRRWLNAFRPHDIHFKIHNIHTGMYDVSFLILQGGIHEAKDSQNDRMGSFCAGYRPQRVLAGASAGLKRSVCEHGSA